MDDNEPVASSSLDTALDLHEQFREALESSQRLAYHDFERQSKELLEKIERKRDELENYFREREQELEESRQAFRLAQRDAIAAAEQLQQVQTELDVHRQQGHKQLKEIKVALKDLLSAVRGATVKHLFLGGSLLGVHMILFLQAMRRREQQTS